MAPCCLRLSSAIESQTKMTAEAGEDVVRSLDGLDKLLEHRLRLALCVLLSRFESMSFSRLKKLTGETDGNLGANLRKLEDARYVRVKKCMSSANR